MSENEDEYTSAENKILLSTFHYSSDEDELQAPLSLKQSQIKTESKYRRIVITLWINLSFVALVSKILYNFIYCLLFCIIMFSLSHKILYSFQILNI